MKPIEFKGFNVTFAKDQPEYLPLPAYKDKAGVVTSCWKLKFVERLKILWHGKLYVQNLTFNKPLQPQRLIVDNPIDSNV